tara:strand:+ start:4033 stop:4236 length:204 start_codon:yes stop_codon:yes gene_type:complete
MAQAITSKGIMDELKSLKKEVADLKEQKADVDSVMTEEDYEALREYRKEKREKKLISHEQLKKEFGV